MFDVQTQTFGPCKGSSYEHSKFVQREISEWMEQNEIHGERTQYHYNDHSDEYDVHSFHYIYSFRSLEEALLFKIFWG